MIANDNEAMPLNSSLSLIFLIVISHFSENIERYRKIIQQRIVAVKEESNRKYGNLIGSIPGRMQQLMENKGVSLPLNEGDE
jgi:hypothetical protein